MIQYVFNVRRKKKRRRKKQKVDMDSGSKTQQKINKKNMSQNPNDINQKMSLFTISQGAYANETNQY